MYARNVPKLRKISLFETREHKNRREKFELLLKLFANSFRKNPPICAGNVPKLPKMSLFEPKEKSQKSMVSSKFALQ